MNNLLKISKKILLFILMLVFSINSFAAVSIQDGSTFVTKAEFSVDMNNLSNRMSKLENSIDTKIDSYVSAYLNENGVWNGDKQKLHFDDTVYVGFDGSGNNRILMYYNFVPSRANNYSFTAEQKNYHYDITQVQSTNTINSDDGTSTSTVNAATEKTLILNTTKSGLMVIKYDKQFSMIQDDWSSDLSNKVVFAAYRSGSGRLIGDQISVMPNANLVLTEYKKDQTTGTVIYTDNQRLLLPVPSAVKFFRAKNNVVYAFVSKQSKITMKVENGSTLNNVGMYCSTTTSLKPSAVYKFHVTNCAIY